MLVTAQETFGTIGGGQLEYQCTRLAFDMLGDEEQAELRKFPLGSSMGQCCGGVVDILFEPVASILPKWLHDLRALHGQREPAIVATDLSGAGDKFIVTADSVFSASEVDAAVVAAARGCYRWASRGAAGWLVSGNYRRQRFAYRRIRRRACWLGGCAGAVCP